MFSAILLLKCLVFFIDVLQKGIFLQLIVTLPCKLGFKSSGFFLK